MIKRASEEGSVKVAEKFIKAYQEDASWLGVRPADFHPRATGHIGDIIEIVKLEKGPAYRIGGDVYFSIRFSRYGKLSTDPEEREAGARPVDLKKKHHGCPLEGSQTR